MDINGGGEAQWPESLRVKSRLDSSRLLLRSEGGDRFRAAQALQHDIDRCTSGLTQTLKLGEQLAEKLKRPPNIMFVPASHQRSVSAQKRAKTSMSLQDNEDDELLTKKELIEKVMGGIKGQSSPSSRVVNLSAVEALEGTVPRTRLVNNNPLRSSHLWSKKSYDLFKRLRERVVPGASLPLYEVLSLYCKGDSMGVVDTYYPSRHRDSIESCYNDWSFYRSRFEIAKARYIQAEIEPLVMMLTRHAHNHEPASSEGGYGGTASIAPLRAVLKAVRNQAVPSSHSEISAKSKQTENPIHIRPLFTAGDLMLALFELTDPSLFSKGVIQMIGDLPCRDGSLSWSPEVHYFRVHYRLGKPNKWSYLSPKKHLFYRNEDVFRYCCPHLCNSAFDVIPIKSSMETVEMKVWVSNFVRSYKNVNGLEGSTAVDAGNDYSSRRWSNLGAHVVAQKAPSLESIVLDVQLIRHIEDGYLHSSQLKPQSKAELRAQEQERCNIFDDELDSVERGDVISILRGGKNYEIKFRLLHVVSATLSSQRSNPVDSAVGTSVSGFHNVRKKESPQAAHTSKKLSPENVQNTHFRNILDEIPQLDLVGDEGEDVSPEEEPAGAESALSAADDDQPPHDDNEPAAEAEPESCRAEVTSSDAKTTQQTDDAMTRFIKQISLSKTSSPDGKKSPTTGKNERKKKLKNEDQSTRHAEPSEADAFLKSFRAMNEIYNSTKEQCISKKSDEENAKEAGATADEEDSGQDTETSECTSSDDSEENEVVILQKERPVTGDSHLSRVRARKAMLEKQKKAAEAEARRNQEMVVLLELDQKRKRKLKKEVENIVKEQPRKLSVSALYMYDTESNEPPPPIQLLGGAMKNEYRDLHIDEGQEGGKLDATALSDSERAITSENQPIANVSNDSKPEKDMSKRKRLPTRLGRKNSFRRVKPMKRPRNSLASVGAGGARSRKIDIKKGQYGNIAEELTKTPCTTVSEDFFIDESNFSSLQQGIDSVAVGTLEPGGFSSGGRLIPERKQFGSPAYIPNSVGIQGGGVDAKEHDVIKEITCDTATTTQQEVQLLGQIDAITFETIYHKLDFDEIDKNKVLLHSDEEPATEVPDEHMDKLDENSASDSDDLQHSLAVPTVNINFKLGSKTNLLEDRSLSIGFHSMNDSISDLVETTRDNQSEELKDLAHFQGDNWNCAWSNFNACDALLNSEVQDKHDQHDSLPDDLSRVESSDAVRSLQHLEDASVLSTFQGLFANDVLSHLPFLEPPGPVLSEKDRHTSRFPATAPNKIRDNFQGSDAAGDIFPVVVGRKAPRTTVMEGERAHVLRQKDTDPQDYSFLIRSSSDGEFAPMSGKCIRVTQLSGVSGPGPRNNIGISPPTSSQKRALSPRTVNYDDSTLSLSYSHVSNGVDVRGVSGNERLRSANEKTSSTFRYAKSPSYLPLTANFQRPPPRVRNNRQRNADTVSDLGCDAEKSVEKLDESFPQVSGEEIKKKSILDNSVRLESFTAEGDIEVRQICNSVAEDMEVETDWRKWQLEQYEIWGNKLSAMNLGRDACDGPLAYVSDNLQELNINPRPHSSPSPRSKARKALSNSAFPENSESKIIATPPTIPRPSTSGHTYMRARIVIPMARSSSPSTMKNLCANSNVEAISKIMNEGNGDDLFMSKVCGETFLAPSHNCNDDTSKTSEKIVSAMDHNNIVEHNIKTRKVKSRKTGKTRSGKKKKRRTAKDINIDGLLESLESHRRNKILFLVQNSLDRNPSKANGDAAKAMTYQDPASNFVMEKAMQTNPPIFISLKPESRAVRTSKRLAFPAFDDESYEDSVVLGDTDKVDIKIEFEVDGIMDSPGFTKDRILNSRSARTSRFAPVPVVNVGF